MNGWKSFTWVNQDMCQCYTQPVMKYGCHQGVCSPIDPCIVSCWISNHPGPCIDREKSAHENTYLVPLSPMYLLPKKNQLSWFISMLLHIFFRRASKAASALACTDWIEKQCEKRLGGLDMKIQTWNEETSYMLANTHVVSSSPPWA